MLPENIFAKSNHIVLCGRFKKISTAATLCCNHQRYYQLGLNKSRMLGLRKLLQQRTKLVT